MLPRKKVKNDILSKNTGLNRSIRTKDRKKRIHDQVHVGLQDRLEKEMKIRDGATRLMGACTHETQLLEAAKTLHTSNSRTLAFMAQLQKLKAAEAMEALMSEPGPNDSSKVCKGRIAISDIRIPLVWTETFLNKNKDHHRHAVFCLLSVNSEVQDTELVCVDKTTTDISFNDIIVFEKANFNFQMSVEVFACPMSATSVSAPTPQKLLSRMNRSIGRGEGKRSREQMKENINGIKNGSPLYTKIASLTLTLADVCDAMRSHDLNRTNQQRLSLPLYENLTCRLVTQPKCVTDISLSGFLHVLIVASVPNWSYMWCEVKAGTMKGWRNPEESNRNAQFAIDLIPKDVKINEIEKSRQKRQYSFQVRDLTDRHIFAAENNETMIKWIRGLRQHKSDHGAWGVACSSDKRGPMFIGSPPSRNVPSDMLFDRGVRKTLIYDQLGADSPLKAVAEAIRCTDLIKDGDSDHLVEQSVHAVLLGNQTTAPWTGFFTGLSAKPAKVIKRTDIQRNNSAEAILEKHSYNLRSSKTSSPTDSGPRLTKQSSEASGSDDAFLSDSENFASRKNLPIAIKSPASVGTKKKRRAPKSPWDEAAKPLSTPPPKPPLPKLPPKQKSKRGSLSSVSSLDDILENQSNRKTSSVARSRVNNLINHDDQIASNGASQRSSQSSGYKSEAEEGLTSKVGERFWVSKKNCVIPSIPVKQKKELCFERSKSLDCDGFHSKHPHLLTPCDAQKETHSEGRPRNNTLPKTSPTKSSPGPNHPVLRRSYLAAVESSKVNHYETIRMVAQRDDLPMTYRRLHYDENAKVYCQAKPPVLPPKLKKQQSAEEPVYAQIDKTKKEAARRAKSVEAYAKAHRAMISVCRKRMEEEHTKDSDRI